MGGRDGCFSIAKPPCDYWSDGSCTRQTGWSGWGYPRDQLRSAVGAQPCPADTVRPVGQHARRVQRVSVVLELPIVCVASLSVPLPSVQQGLLLGLMMHHLPHCQMSQTGYQFNV